MKKVCFIYPVITSYVLPVLEGMANHCHLTVIYSKSSAKERYNQQNLFEHPNVTWVELTTFRPRVYEIGMYQIGILSHIIRLKPDVILTWTNPRFISFWAVLITGKLLGIEVYPRGHGFATKSKVSPLRKIMYRILMRLSTKYICYTPSVEESLRDIVPDKGKLVVDFNTIYNDFPISPSLKIGNEKGVLFIGRLRPRCGIKLLIDSIDILNTRDGLDIVLHIIGDGPLYDHVNQQIIDNPWINYHGKVYEDKVISEISLSCKIGCYPGDMGLSVVHFMSLSLPVITHGELTKHMGPEPSYLINGYNGHFYFPRMDIESLVKTIKKIWIMPEKEFHQLSINAYKTYQDLSIPPIHERLATIMDISHN